VVANATAGFTQALSTIDFKAGDAIVTSRCDYTSNQIQYLALKKRLGVQVLHAADLPEGGVDPDSLLTWCSNIAAAWLRYRGYRPIPDWCRMWSPWAASAVSLGFRT